MVKEVFKPRREVNKVVKKGKPKDVRVGILFPLPYNAASSSLAFHLLYEYINEFQDAIAYRFVYNMEVDLFESLDHSISLRDLDLILMSTSFELDYLNVARILNSLQLLPYQRKRNKPIIVAGGLAATANPFPLSKIADAVVIGEVDEIIGDIVYSVQETDPIKILENIKCVWISMNRDSIVEKCVVENLDRVFHPLKQVYSVDEEPAFGYGLRIELSRGCPYMCPFCLESHVTYPYRFRSYDIVWRIIEKGFEFTPLAKRTIFYSLSFFSIPYVDKLLNKLLDENIQVSIPSLRLEHLTNDRIEIIYKLGQKTLTIAPEVLITSYACRIGKCFDVDKLISIILTAYSIGYNHVKMYLMAGFPKLSVEEEVNALKNFLDKLKKFIKRKKFIELSLNILIPKPWTPFQYLPANYVIKSNDRIKTYKNLIKNYRFASIDAMDPKWGFAQAVIALGNSELSDLIIRCVEEGCSLSKFLNLVSSNTDRLRYVVDGWKKDPPWIKSISMKFNPTYLEYRFKFLT
jgi:radical SAM superfamily enzyme YgiQ (UPF0313 family)